MTEFLQSIKSDLLSRHMLPLLIVLAVALVAAVGYAVTAGSASSTQAVSASVPSTSGSTVTGAGSAPVSVAPTNPEQAVSETPGGLRYQSQGPTRDPFTPLPNAKTATSTSSHGSHASKSSSPGGSSSSSGGSPSTGKGSGGNSVPAPAPAKPSEPTKPQNPYTVAVLFGVPSSTPGQTTTLVPYPSVKVGQSLPSKQDARVTFERVTSDGKGAVFKLVVPPILHGTGICLPSTSECETIDLEADKYEVLEYIEADGQSVTYELGVVSVAKNDGTASAARVKRAVDSVRAKRLARLMHAASQASVAGE